MVLLLALVLAPALPAGANGAAEDDPDVRSLTAELAQVTGQTTQLASRLEAAAALDGGLRARADDLAAVHERAVDAFERRVRAVYIAQLTERGPTLTVSPDRRLLDAAAAGSLSVDRRLVAAVAEQSVQAQALEVEAQAYRDGLRSEAAEVLLAQERARSLLAEAQAVLQHRRETEQADADREAVGQLATFRVQLDAASATVTAALTPAQTGRTRQAAGDQGPVLALLVAAGSALPDGYSRTGQIVSGEATWYGPGFVGSPTASGAPYDPELLTCAHKTLPLGTVLHVTRGALATNCLVNDRGPYVGARVLDLSRAGSRALAYDGVAQVVAEVLTPA